MFYLLIGLVLGLIPAFIAKAKGQSFMAWWCYGGLLFIIALIHSIFMSRYQRVAE